MSHLTAGIDVSLCSTGLVILDGGKIVSQELVKSKPHGDSYQDETIRLIDILTRITALGTEFARRLKDVELCVIEGLSYCSQGKTRSIMQLAALHYGVRMNLEMLNKKAVIVAPQSLKKFATGHGNAKKEEIMLEVYKRWAVSFSSNDLADAYALAVIGRNLLEEDTVCLKPQHEVLDMLKTQL
jgi:crossover junction endodeoxyribonuclease RuvC